MMRRVTQRGPNPSSPWTRDLWTIRLISGQRTAGSNRIPGIQWSKLHLSYTVMPGKDGGYWLQAKKPWVYRF